jgi:hypothetical protein
MASEMKLKQIEWKRAKVHAIIMSNVKVKLQKSTSFEKIKKSEGSSYNSIKWTCGFLSVMLYVLFC